MQYFIRNGVSCVRVAFGFGRSLGGFWAGFGKLFGSFLGRFWDGFGRPGNVKNEQKRGRVVLFLIFGGCNIRRRFGAVLEGSWGGFWELFRRFWLDFGALKGVQF